MREYLISVVTVSALISAALTVLYKNERESSGAAKGAFAVMLLYVTVLPLIGAISELDVSKIKFSSGDFDFSSESALASSSSAAFEDGVKLFLCEEFSLDKNEVDVSCEGFSQENMQAEKIVVTLRGKSKYADVWAIKEKTEKNGLGRCEVKIEI